MPGREASADARRGNRSAGCPVNRMPPGPVGWLSSGHPGSPPANVRPPLPPRAPEPRATTAAATGPPAGNSPALDVPANGHPKARRPTSPCGQPGSSPERWARSCPQLGDSRARMATGGRSQEAPGERPPRESAPVAGVILGPGGRAVHRRASAGRRAASPRPSWAGPRCAGRRLDRGKLPGPLRLARLGPEEPRRHPVGRTRVAGRTRHRRQDRRLVGRGLSGNRRQDRRLVRWDPDPAASFGSDPDADPGPDLGTTGGSTVVVSDESEDGSSEEAESEEADSDSGSGTTGGSTVVVSEESASPDPDPESGSESRPSETTGETIVVSSCASAGRPRPRLAPPPPAAAPPPPCAASPAAAPPPRPQPRLLFREPPEPGLLGRPGRGLRRAAPPPPRRRRPASSGAGARPGLLRGLPLLSPAARPPRLRRRCAPPPRRAARPAAPAARAPPLGLGLRAAPPRRSGGPLPPRPSARPRSGPRSPARRAAAPGRAGAVSTVVTAAGPAPASTTR